MLYVIEDSDQLEACRNVLYVVARTTDLIQIATAVDGVFLFRPKQGRYSDAATEVLRSQRISKVCVRHVSGDKRKLADMGITIFPETLIDMVVYAKKRGLDNPGFVGICASVGYKLRESRDQLVGNWNQLRLSSEQIQYAANDAWFPLLVACLWGTLKADDEILSKMKSMVSRKSQVTTATASRRILGDL
ncbi:hypothetical protein FOZ60_008446 [Perkinsus olseni]|uniref:3'-5' exonuclease domain-containing protein n=1 Tax=Perkinsus olseni TaxID=32597 RepID=A0A7J6PDM8_PEROL|nr:hypothetical protein FOZ60_008446 [Perkinsus olseni]